MNLTVGDLTATHLGQYIELSAFGVVRDGALTAIHHHHASTRVTIKMSIGDPIADWWPHGTPCAVSPMIDFPAQTCMACGVEHPGAGCGQSDLFGGAA